MNDKFSEFEFHYAFFEMQPYSESAELNSNKLLREVIHTLNSPEFPPEFRVINRHKNRSKAQPRNLVHISSPIERNGARVFGRIALIKN